MPARLGVLFKMRPYCFFFSSRRRHTRFDCDWSSDVCSSDLFEKIMRAHPLDFVQLSYNILDREAESRILPLARGRGIAVIVNRPFREGDLIKKKIGRASCRERV